MHGKWPILAKKLALVMIRYTPASERTLSLFRTPYEQSLDPDNRWVRMAAVVPWDEMAKVFFVHMSADHGRASIDLRIILGALLVKHIEGISDEDTILCIQENVYAQYFVGLPSFQSNPICRDSQAFGRDRSGSPQRFGITSGQEFGSNQAQS